MPQEPFWFVDDEQHVRWAVRVNSGCPMPWERWTEGATIIFTSRHEQITASYPLDKEQHELTRYEMLELLATAKRAALPWRAETQPRKQLAA